MWKCTRSGAFPLRKGLTIIAIALAASGIGGLTIGCTSGDTQSGQEEFTAYWNAMWKVVERENAQTDKALAKADETDGALNAYGAYYIEKHAPALVPELERIYGNLRGKFAGECG